LEKYIIEQCADKEAELIIDNLVKYNLSKVPIKQTDPFIWINRVVKDEDGKIAAGILSKMYCWNCLYIDTLWVREDFRKSGLGSKLLKEIEKIAKEKECHIIHLDTFDFQAKDFYIKHGYKIFGQLDECPKEHVRFFMKKSI
jgi:GNAT superfamily N-acetyltransferase